MRTLFYDELNKVLWWNEPGAAARGGSRHRPSSLLSLRKEQPLPLIKLLEVRELGRRPVVLDHSFFNWSACTPGTICWGAGCPTCRGPKFKYKCHDP